MASDDILTRPLGGKPSAKDRLRSLARVRVTLPAAMGGVLACILAAGSVLVAAGDPNGGEPSATAAITLREPSPPSPAQAAPAPGREPGASGRSSASEVESASGVTVTRPAGTAAPGDAVVIRVPAPTAVRLAPAPDPRLTDRGRHGSLPRIGDGRVRPLDVYARPDAEPGSSRPRIAILVSGLGIGQSVTAAAITRLPPAISLAFAPYGADLERSVARARDFGHEALLQAPMEPFDYPDSDPGPQTMLTTSRPPENLDRLAWVMSRFSGYVGLVNFMGAKLAGDAAALEPILREIGARGLGFVDDGTAPRSVVGAVGAKTRTPVALAESVLDAVPSAEAIDRALARLEDQARAKGFVLASASAMPLTIERLARWSRDLEARGIRLVPVSTALRGPPSGTRVGSAAP